MFTIVESSLFSRLVFDYLSEEEYEDLKLFLALNPESGDVIPGSGGLHRRQRRIAIDCLLIDP